MKASRTLPLILLLAFSVALSAAPPTSSEDSAVLSVIIQHHCAATREQPHSGYEVIPNKSVQILGGKALAQSSPKQLPAGAIQSLLQRNEVRHVLPKFALCQAVKVVPTSQLSHLADWAAFSKLFPGASSKVTLSLPGYSASGKVAIVQVGKGCGPMCGFGTYVVLRKVDDKWVIAKRVPAWIS